MKDKHLDKVNILVQSLLNKQVSGMLYCVVRNFNTPTQAVEFMNFDIPQIGNTRFMYLLPFSPTKALVEYTLFSKDLLEKEEYIAEIETFRELLAKQNNNIKFEF